jgi:hypothetical protein
VTYPGAKYVSPQENLLSILVVLLFIIFVLPYLLPLNGPPTVDPTTLADPNGAFVQAGDTRILLKSRDETAVQDLRMVIADFNQPFIAEAIHDELWAGRELVFDLDLMGQSVSSTSRTYPDVAFGSLRVDHEIRLGYQLARVCVQTVR